jgi:hypothetical protein
MRRDSHEDRGKETVMKRMVGVATLSVAILAGAGAAQADPASAQSKLTAVAGQGTGSVKVTPTAEDQGTLHIQGQVNVHGALANTTFSVQRAVDFSPGDEMCTIAPSPPDGWVPLATLTTSPGGAGAAHFERATGLESGEQFDVILRVVSEDGNQVLVSECMTVTAK